MSPISNQTSDAPAMLQNDDGRYYSYGILKYFWFYINFIYICTIIMYINIFIFIYRYIYIYICIDYVGNDLVLFALKHGLVLSLLVRSQNAEEVGRINYVPITAVQRFDMEKKFIRNGVLWQKFHF